MAHLDHRQHPYFPVKAGPERFWEERDPSELTSKEIATTAPKTATDVQRLKLEKLQKNMDRPVKIPSAKKEWSPPPPPQFVRNVVGSSAGAGSGEYHIYRNLRRKEYARVEHRAKVAEQEEKDEAWEAARQQRDADEAAKAAKRKAKNAKKKAAKKRKLRAKGPAQDSDDDDDDDDTTTAETQTKDSDAPPAE